MRTLNRTFRDQDRPTNVLSFPSLPDTRDGNRRYLGDIVLAAETVASEAQTLTLAPEHHLQHLIVHGLLHLLGYDHEDERDAETMEAIEIQILRRLGIADPYADPRSCADAPQRQDQS